MGPIIEPPIFKGGAWNPLPPGSAPMLLFVSMLFDIVGLPMVPMVPIGVIGL